MTILRLISAAILVSMLTACGGDTPERGKDKQTPSKDSKDGKTATVQPTVMPTDFKVVDDAAAADALFAKVVAAYRAADQYMSTKVGRLTTLIQGQDPIHGEFNTGIVLDRKRQYLRVLDDMGQGPQTEYIYSKYRHIRQAVGASTSKERMVATLPQLGYFVSTNAHYGNLPDGVFLTNDDPAKEFGPAYKLVSRKGPTGELLPGLLFPYPAQSSTILLMVDPKTHFVTDFWQEIKGGFHRVIHFKVNGNDLSSRGLPESELRPMPDDKLRLLDQAGPEFVFETLGGKRISTKNADGPTLVLYFWHGNFKESMIGLKDMQETFGPDGAKFANVNAIAVNLLQPEEDVRQLMKDNGITINVARLPEESDMDVFEVNDAGKTLIIHKGKIVLSQKQEFHGETGFDGPLVELVLKHVSK